MRIIVNNYYEESGEQDLVRKAVEASSKEQLYNGEIDGNVTLSAKLKPPRYILVFSLAHISHHICSLALCFRNG